MKQSPTATPFLLSQLEVRRYSGDEPHFVVHPEGGDHDKIIVYIPGTTDRPSLSSCLIKSMSESLSFPILALSYQYLSSGDKFRNGKCELLVDGDDRAEQIDCLKQQHVDAIDGGNYGATHFEDDGSAFWGEVLPENSLTRRLGDLLILLHSTYPNGHWSNFLQADMSTPAWENIVFSGHSQGSGHVAYLAIPQTLYKWWHGDRHLPVHLHGHEMLSFFIIQTRRRVFCRVVCQKVKEY